MTKIKLKKITYILLTTLIVLLLLSIAGYQYSKLRSFQFFGGLTSRVSTEKKVLALTFDDAPTSYTKEVLDILKSKETKATFYVVGKDMVAQPDIGKAITQSGHELGNHSYFHNALVFKTPSSINSEIKKTNMLIRLAGYNGEITFRPPYGKKLFVLPWVLKQNNMKTIMWDVEPDTYHNGDSEGIVKFTLDNVKPGSIIIMHPFCDSTCSADRQALPIIIDKLKENGYQFLTVSELLKLQNK